MNEKHIDFESTKQELEKMKIVSSLIDEVRPYYLNKMNKQKNKVQKLKVACVALAFICFGAFGTMLHNESGLVDSIAYSDISIEDMGFEVDEYGLLLVE